MIYLNMGTGGSNSCVQAHAAGGKSQEQRRRMVSSRCLLAMCTTPCKLCDWLRYLESWPSESFGDFVRTAECATFKSFPMFLTQQSVTCGKANESFPTS